MDVRVFSLFKNRLLQNCSSSFNFFLRLLSLSWAGCSLAEGAPLYAVASRQNGSTVSWEGRQSQDTWMVTRKIWVKSQKQEGAQ